MRRTAALPDVEMVEDRQFCEIDLNGVAWLALADDADARIAGLPRKVGGQILRYTPRRRVLYAAGPPALLIKQYFHAGLIELTKNFFRGTPARREWRALRDAERRHIPVPKALALGVQRRASIRQSFLVTEFIAPAESLEELLRGKLAAGRKRRILHKAALLIRQMHDCGYYHRDLHFGNLLVRQRDEEAELFLLDLQRIDVDPFFASAKRWRDLAELQGGVADMSRSDRLRFLQAYLFTSPVLTPDKRRLIAKLHRDGRRHRFRVWSSREKRCLAENREFTKIEIGGFTGWARRSAWHQAMESAFAEPGRVLAHADIIKDSKTATVGSLMTGGQKIFVKRYHYQGVAYAIKDWFRSSRAKRGWKAGNNCHMRGLDVALPLVYLERRHWRVLRESYVVTAALEGEELSLLLARRGRDVLFKRELLGQLARQLRRMHCRGITYRDLKGENIIVKERHQGRYEFSIVDFDGMASGPTTWRARAKNIARLLRAAEAHSRITCTDRWRFVKVYLGAGEASRRRKLYRDVARFTKRA